MLDTVMKVSLTLTAFDKMSRVIKDAVNKSNDEFNKMQSKIKEVSQNLDKIGRTAAIAGGAMLGMAAVNLKTAADFEKQMANVSTLIKISLQ